MIKGERGVEWPEARVAELTRLHTSGTSYTKIGLEMGISRSAVSGMIRRLGLPPRTINRPGPRASSPRLVNPKVEPVPQPEPEAAPEAPREPMRLADAERHHCRYPVGEFAWPDFWICGRDAMLGRTYCRQCCAKVYQPLRRAG